MAFHVFDVSVSSDPLSNSPQMLSDFVIWLQILVEVLEHVFSVSVIAPSEGTNWFLVMGERDRKNSYTYLRYAYIKNRYTYS